MIRIAALLLLAAAAPGEDVATGPQETLRAAIETLDARLEMLEELRSRRAAGDRISLDALRGRTRRGDHAEQTLARERAAIEDLKDAIRVAQATRRRPAPEPPPSEGTAETVPEETEPPAPPPAPVDLPTRGPLAARAAEARYRSADYAGALALYEAEAKASGSTWARLRQARCLERLGREKEARQAYEALVKDAPDDRWGASARWSLEVLDLGRSTVKEKESR